VCVVGSADVWCVIGDVIHGNYGDGIAGGRVCIDVDVVIWYIDAGVATDGVVGRDRVGNGMDCVGNGVGVGNGVDVAGGVVGRRGVRYWWCCGC